MATTTAPTGQRLDMRRAQHAVAGVQGWATKAAALADLGGLREVGLNCERDIEVSQAETRLWRFWVISRPDHFNGTTSLMTSDGRWVSGRLADSPCFCSTPCPKGHPVPWTPLAGEPVPATVTHNYGYSAGSVGVLGSDGLPLMHRGFFGPPTEALAWLASAWCVACRWSVHDDREDTVRAAARHHRAHPAEYAGHAIARREPARSA